jgi:glycosyltransferase involved in cell wall biosynthesis
MIVKDEAHTIASTLRSIKGHIDRWIILDTGSTDGTQEVVKNEMAGVPGELHEAPFVDFATTRNRALDLCGEATEMILWLDADDEVINPVALRKFLHRERPLAGPDREAYYVQVEMGIRFDQARVLRASAHWRFEGVVHEVLTHPDRQPPTIRVPDTVIKHHLTDVSVERSRRRWQRDLELLLTEHEKNPTHARTAFYLAQTYAQLGLHREASRAYRKRIELGGWYEEVFYSKYQLGRMADAMGEPWPEVLALYLDAYAFNPRRVEPLYEIGRHYNAAAEHALCVLFARRGYEVPVPNQERLFVDADVYLWKLADLVGSSAYWIGEFELGEEAARRALRHRPDDPRLRANLGFYIDRKKRR